MRYLVFSLVVMFLFLSGVLSTTIGPARGVLETDYQPIASEWLPGNPLPPNTCCCYKHLYEQSELTCRIERIRDSIVWLDYDQRLRVISRSNIYDMNITVGDLILAWGTPLGYLQVGNNHYLFWTGRFAEAIDPSFTPASKVHLVQYNSKADDSDYTAWKGFTN